MFFGEPKNIPDVFFGPGSRFPFRFKGSRIQGSPFSCQECLNPPVSRTANPEF
jgi:hypothetical protein